MDSASRGSTPNTAEISITGHAEWELSVHGLPLVRVAYGRPTLPRPELDVDEFADIARRILGHVDLNHLWATIQHAQTSRHGMAIVVSGDPEHEVSRLGKEAVPIDPRLLEPAEVVRLGRVDGAVLLGADARCHAFGVILDGTASGEGDPARGSRFNSAVRYQKTTAAHSIVVVISADGMIDLIPRLRPQVYREHVAEAVRAFRACCETQHVDGSEFARTHDLVWSYAFYLNEEQCCIVNETYEAEMNRRLAAGGIALFEAPLGSQPNPDMNDTYFL